MGELGFFPEKRKHRINADIEAATRPTKRVRLESMFEKLSLDSVTESSKRDSHLQINPLLDSTEPQAKMRRTPDVDTLILEKMARAYKDHILQRLALVRCAHPLKVIIWHFQKWIKRLFNVFVRKYNKRYRGSQTMKPFKDLARIIALTRDANVAFSYHDLLNIVLEENTLEAQRLLLKKEKKLDSDKLQEIKEEEELARESSYTYWDRVSTLSRDVDMDEYGGDSYFVGTQEKDNFSMPGSTSDVDMFIDVENAGCLVEENYGNYCGKSYSESSA